CLKGGHRWPTTNTVGKTLIPTLTQNPLLTRHQNNKIPIRLSHHLKPVLCPWSGLLLPCRTRTCRPVKLLRKFPSQSPLRRSRDRPRYCVPRRRTRTPSHRYANRQMSNKKLPMRKKKSIRILDNFQPQQPGNKRFSVLRIVKRPARLMKAPTGLV